MARWTLVTAVVAVTLFALVVAIAHVLDRDRTAAEDELARDKLAVVTEAATELGTQLEKIDDELELAPALARTAETRAIAERELAAITATHPAFLLLDVRTGDGGDVRATAPLAPGELVATANRVVDSMIERARRAPEELVVSAELGSAADAGAWYRVVARRDPQYDATVAAVVDIRQVMVPPAVLHAGASRVLLLGTHDEPAPATDPEIAGTWHRPELAALAQLIAAARARRPATAMLDSDAARTLALPGAPALAAAAPVPLGGSSRAHDAGLTPWVLAVVTSTDALQARHDALVWRIAIGLSLGLLLLVLASLYVVRNARRAAAENILDNIPSGVLALDHRGIVTAANRWFAARGLDVIGASLRTGFDRAPARDAERLVALVDDARAAGAPRTLFRELRLLGDDACLDVHAVPLANAPHGVATLVVLEDVSELQRAEDRLLRSEKLATAGQLSAGIAHEIGTPLGVARGRVEMVLAALGRDTAETANLRIATDQIDHVTRQIQQLLDYVRPHAQRVERVPVPTALRRVVELLEGHAASHAVSLDVEADPDTPAVRADPNQLEQVLVNLGINAIDACGRGGRVTLRAHPRDVAAIIEIADDGHGIAAADRAQVFDPFFTTKKRGRGTGLGLWMVAQVVRSHDAEIEVESAVGVGTTFRITWPCDDGPAPSHAPASPGRAAAPEAARSASHAPASPGRAAAPEAARSASHAPASPGRAAAPEAARSASQAPASPGRAAAPEAARSASQAPASPGRAAAPEAARSASQAPASPGRAAAPEAARSASQAPASPGRAAAPEAARSASRAPASPGRAAAPEAARSR